ncbi:MAG: ribosomal protein S18-alanine N-acetyltransferase [Gemmatimonadetes bacterium]|nr:ribosomal protein S18-alanine N-acetyltransferase [Gemmatimonadota bacterium]
MDLEDIADVAALEAEVFPDAWSVDSFLAEIERKPEIGYPLVVRDEDTDELIAYAVVWFIVDELHIGNIAVRPDLQGRGIAAQLMEHIIEEGRRRALSFATLEVRPSNAPAVALYDRFGFKKIAVRKNYYRDNQEDAHVLALALTPAGEARFA